MTMEMETERLGIGGNNPPSPIDLVIDPFADVISEAENWLDGEPVANEGQMKAVDALAKAVKAARKAVKDARDAATAPLHAEWKAEIDRWKPAEEDLDRIVKGLASIVGDFKKKLAAEKEAERRAAYAEAERMKREAEAAAAKADAGNIEAQREVLAAKQAALEATKAAQATSKERVTGLRRVHRYEVEDHRAALHWIAVNDRDAVTEFIESYVKKHHRTARIDGVRQWEEKESF